MGLFKRLLRSNTRSVDKSKKTDHSKYYPEEKLPVDEKFTYNFNKNGGKFIYCENWEEISETFDDDYEEGPRRKKVKKSRRKKKSENYEAPFEHFFDDDYGFNPKDMFRF